MTTTFGGSRLANLRDKRTSGDENMLKTDSLKLSLPDQSEKSSYEPSVSYNPGRSQTRLLKGRIDRASQIENKPKNEAGSSQGLKLVLNDDPPARIEERKSTTDSSAMRSTLKRILVSKQSEKEKEPEPVVEQPRPQQIPDEQPERPTILNHDERPIQEEDVEESLPQAECDLVECPEGCGRKFNRKALEKHAKACKLVFMSKRKQFNSEAKRLVNKEQEKLVKDKKAKDKKQGRNKNKGGFEKTSDNWKTASQGFRAAIKAIKKDGEEQAQQQDQQQEMKIITCQYCEKPFAEVFLEKHIQVCGRRKEVQKKKTFKKK